MTQNKTSAVMAQRSEPHDSLDFFPTPAWATRALCDVVLGDKVLRQMNAWDPAAGEGHMVRPLAEYFRIASGSDIFDYGAGFQKFDFLFETSLGTDWVITNPPFRLADQFVEHALGLAEVGVAMLVRTQFLEGVGRYKGLFSKRRPATVAIFTERVPIIKGKVARWVINPKTGKPKRVTSATSYCWVVWDKDAPAAESEFVWIPPCRKRLERDEDYSDPIMEETDAV